MKYKEILSDKILDQFGKYKDEIGNLELEEGDFKIDIFKIAEICNVDVKEFEKYHCLNEGEMRFKAAKKITYKIRGYDKYEQIQ